VQIGALSGVAGRHIGLASGLVETMREIGGAVMIALVSTVLVSEMTESSSSAPQSVSIDGFQAAFYVIVVAVAAGALVASVAFPRSPQPVEEWSAEGEELLPEAT
jgi:methylmalonyl-CoA mutase cobalamin-binding subunit